jgi:hypothetical protein
MVRQRGLGIYVQRGAVFLDEVGQDHVLALQLIFDVSERMHGRSLSQTGDAGEEASG